MCNVLAWIVFGLSIACLLGLIVYLGKYKDEDKEEFTSPQVMLGVFGSLFALIGLTEDPDNCDSQGPMIANGIALALNFLICVLPVVYFKWKDCRRGPQ